ncbi:MAG: YsnF/AvaK domain-containing protein [Caldimonas sp.]
MVAKKVAVEQPRQPKSVAATRAIGAADDRSIQMPIIDDVIQVDIQVVDRGGYRISKRVTERQEMVDEVLRDHRVVVERRPIGLTLLGDEIPEQRYEGDVLIIPVIEEILVTEKRLLLVEEVRVRQIAGTHRKVQQVTLKKEEVSVERLSADDRSDAEPS